MKDGRTRVYAKSATNARKLASFKLGVKIADEIGELDRLKIRHVRGRLHSCRLHVILIDRQRIELGELQGDSRKTAKAAGCKDVADPR